MPAVLEHREQVLGLRQQLQLRHLVRALPDVLARERQPLLVVRRIQPDLDRRVADVRDRPDENRARVLDRLPRLPLRGRHRRVVIVGPHQLFVGVDDVDHDAVVLVERRVVGDDELVGDLERAAGGALSWFSVTVGVATGGAGVLLLAAAPTASAATRHRPDAERACDVDGESSE